MGPDGAIRNIQKIRDQTEACWTILDQLGPYIADHTGLYRTIRGHKRAYGVILGQAGSYVVIRGSYGANRTILDHKEP